MAPGGEGRDTACTAAEPCDAMAAASRLRPRQLPLSGSLGKLYDITVLRSLRRRQMRMRGVPSETGSDIQVMLAGNGGSATH